VRRELLERIVEADKASRPVVLVRSLTDERQFLVDGEDTTGDLQGVPQELISHSRTALNQDGAHVIEAEGERYLVQTLSPPPRLIVIGAVHIAQRLIPMARMAGYDVQLIDPRTAFAASSRFPEVSIINDWPQEVMRDLSLDARTAVVTLSHDAKIDEPALKAALESDAFYIGALGSKKNHAKRLGRLAELGFDEESLARIAGPIGLPLGGRSPAEIAVAILAQMIQARYGRNTR